MKPQNNSSSSISSALSNSVKLTEQDSSNSTMQNITAFETSEIQPSTRQINIPAYDGDSIVESILIEEYSINDDGRYLIFTSSADNLVDEDNNGADDIFVRDLVNDTTQIVSINSDNTQTTSSLFFNTNLNTNPNISSNGRYVAFKSSADNLYVDDDNDGDDIFIRDLVNDTTQIVSINSDGAVSNYAPYGGVVSDRGSVVFESFADNLVTNDSDDIRDIFVRDLANQTTELVSIGSDNSPANDFSYNPDISSDGRYVVFESFADNLVANDSNDIRDIFVRDLVNQTTELVSIGSDNSPANGSNSNPDISSNGKYVVFESSADNLVANDSNNIRDIFVRDLENKTTELVSINRFGNSSADFESSDYKISGDGRYIVFESSTNNLVPEAENNNIPIYVRDLENKTTEQLNIENDSLSSDELSHISNLDISFDGRYITFEADNDIYLHDRGTSFADIASTIEITSVTQNNNEVTINYDVANADSQTQIKLFYDDDNQDLDGVLITDALSESDDSFVWNTERILSGDYYIYAEIADENNSSFSYSAQSVAIIAPDSPPVVSNPLGDITVNENTGDRTIDLSNVFSDEDSDEIVIAVTRNTNLQLISSSIDGTNLKLDFTEEMFGTGEITVEATANGEKVSDTFNITVNEVDFPPVLFSPLEDIIVNENAGDLAIDLSNVFRDEDSDEIVFAVSRNTNSSLVSSFLDGTNLKLDFTEEMFGTGEITIEATANGENVSNTFNITVNEVDSLPVVSNPLEDITVNENAGDLTINLSNVFSDEDGDEIVFAIQGNTNSQLISSSLDGTNLKLDFTEEMFGTGEITIEATANGEKVSDIFNITVNEVDFPPVLFSPLEDITVNENAGDLIIDLSNVFSDEDRDEIVLAIKDNTNSQLISSSLDGTNLKLDFTEEMFGIGEITIEATANGEKVSDTFNITVNEVDFPPVILNPLEDITVNENAEDLAINLSNVFSDEDGDEIIFSIKDNSNSQLISSSLDGTNLKLDFTEEMFGTGEITIEATANGEKVSDIFNITVNQDKPELSLTNVHRFYEYNKGFHLYTIDENEINTIREKSSKGELNYNYEAEQYQVLMSNKDSLTGENVEGVEPIYRFFNNSTGAHLYTMDENESSYIQSNLFDYSFEGIGYYAFEAAPENIETIPVYRMLNSQSGAHLFTSDRNELTNIQENLPHFSLENNGDAVFHVIDL